MEEMRKAFEGTPKEFMKFANGFPKFQRANLCMIYKYLYIQRNMDGK